MIDIRNDGRTQQELRKIKIDMGLSEQSAQTGSAKQSIGTCESISLVKGPYPANLTNEDEKINLKVFIEAPNSSKRVKEKNHQLANVIKNSLLQLIQIVTEKVRLNIEIKNIIISDNGDILSTCFNSCVLALIDAKIPLIGTCAAVTIAIDHENKKLINDPDLSGINKQSLVTVAKRDNGTFVLFHSEGHIDIEMIEKVTNCSDKLTQSLILKFKDIIRDNAI